MGRFVYLFVPLTWARIVYGNDIQVEADLATNTWVFSLVRDGGDQCRHSDAKARQRDQWPLIRHMRSL
jgi:hypothetical protein